MNVIQVGLKNVKLKLLIKCVIPCQRSTSSLQLAERREKELFIFRTAPSFSNYLTAKNACNFSLSKMLPTKNSPNPP